MIERFSRLNSKLYAISEHLRLFNDNLCNLGFHVNARFTPANRLPATSWRAIQFVFARKKEKKKKSKFYVALWQSPSVC